MAILLVKLLKRERSYYLRIIKSREPSIHAHTYTEVVEEKTIIWSEIPKVYWRIVYIQKETTLIFWGMVEIWKETILVYCRIVEILKNNPGLYIGETGDIHVLILLNVHRNCFRGHTYFKVCAHTLGLLLLKEATLVICACTLPVVVKI